MMILAFWLSLMTGWGTVFAMHHDREKPQKKGILLVAFGTTIPEAQVAFDMIEKKTREAFPDIDVRWAFTSRIIRSKLSGEGQILNSVSQGLANMAEEGFSHVAVQSLHTIAGEEFHKLQQTVNAFSKIPGAFEKILLGLPLLGADSNQDKVASAIFSTIPKERKPEEAVVLMGHGTAHASNASYPALMWRLQQKDPNLFVGVVEGYPELSDILPVLTQKKIKKAWLIPFMAVAGDHVRNDMAGPEEDSWKSVLNNAGIHCETILKGTGEYPEFVEIWVDHLRETMNHL